MVLPLGKRGNGAQRGAPKPRLQGVGGWEEEELEKTEQGSSQTKQQTPSQLVSLAAQSRGGRARGSPNTSSGATEDLETRSATSSAVCLTYLCMPPSSHPLPGRGEARRARGTAVCRSSQGPGDAAVPSAGQVTSQVCVWRGVGRRLPSRCVSAAVICTDRRQDPAPPQKEGRE